MINPDNKTTAAKLRFCSSRFFKVSDISPEEFRAAFEEAMQYDGPFVIDTKIDKDEVVLPMLPPGGSIRDIITSVEPE